MRVKNEKKETYENFTEEEKEHEAVEKENERKENKRRENESDMIFVSARGE